ncbi:hypothetical protein KSP40_PGU022270 [Platanthera guangdongensis]|uniref:KIB1-4 beta-propeller domain-containing protein n=1 Tax=Platanthera guangdongensis TaxID=2320717 RepID=A0ABR2M9Z7_9ASPA
MLPLKDFLKFRSICRSWKEAASAMSRVTQFWKEDSWALSYDCDSECNCIFFENYDPTNSAFKIHNLRGAKCLVSKCGWLFMRRSDNYFFNPVTFEEILLPRYPYGPILFAALQIGTFSALPTSKNCIVTMFSFKTISTVEVVKYHFDDNKWEVLQIELTENLTDNVFFGAAGNVQIRLTGSNDSFKAHASMIIFFGINILTFDFVTEAYELNPLDQPPNLGPMMRTSKLLKHGYKYGCNLKNNCSLITCVNDENTTYNWIFHDTLARNYTAKFVWIEPKFSIDKLLPEA